MKHDIAMTIETQKQPSPAGDSFAPNLPKWTGDRYESCENTLQLNTTANKT